MATRIGKIIHKLTPYHGAVVAHVTISRTSKLNCLTSRLFTELSDTIRELTVKNRNLICIVLTGEGEKSFASGADIEEMSALVGHTAASDFITKIHLVCKSIRESPVPVIARINGFALGAGLEIAASCDVRIASRNATFGMPEVRIGLPSVVEAALLPGLIGWGRTRRLLYFGEIISADEALQWGLIEKVVEINALDNAVAEWVHCLTRCGPLALRSQKRLITKWERVGLEAAIKSGIDCFGQSFETHVSGDEASDQGRQTGVTEPARMMGEFLRQQERRRKATL